MKWKRIIRASGLIEWQCEHGVGHPDVNSAEKLGEGWGIHGCDGCCGRKDFPGKKQEVEPSGDVGMRIHAIKFKQSQIRRNMLRSLEEIKGQRLIQGFYYYLNPEKVGDRSKGWLVMAHD